MNIFGVDIGIIDIDIYRTKPGRPGRLTVRAVAALGLAIALLVAFAGLPALPVQAQAEHEVWSATLVIRDSSGVLGCSDGVANNFCSVHLSDNDFRHDSTDYAITLIVLDTNGRLEITFARDLTPASRDLTLNVGGTSFGFEDADSSTPITRQWNDSGLSWTAGETASLSLTEISAEPAMPTELTATAQGETQIDLSWTAPNDDGGEAISGYKVEVSSNGGATWSNLVADTRSTETSYSQIGLSAGNTRTYGVSATNSVGVGSSSRLASATTAAVNVLASNTGQSGTPALGISVGDADKRFSQGFETGSNPGGYRLASVGVYIQFEGLEAWERFAVHIYNANNTGGLGAPVYSLTSPNSYTDIAVNTFTAPAGATLDAETAYHVVYEGGGDLSIDLILGVAPSNKQDLGSRSGWSIENVRRYDGVLSSAGTSFQISVNGTAIPTDVLSTWALVPPGLSANEPFRLLFLSSTARDASASDIGPYNTFVQGRAGVGHAAVQEYHSGFRVVGCTASANARDNTRTIYTTSDEGVPIYWLNGARAADDYEDFYDGSWDDEANDKSESGADGPDTSQDANFPFTGCEHDGATYYDTTGHSFALGSSQGAAAVGKPNSTGVGNGPLSADTVSSAISSRPMYGLSEVFRVVGNTPAEGAPAIGGSAQVGATLSASTSGVTDADGLSGARYRYRWIRVAGGAETTISGATSSAYVPVAADVGNRVKVEVEFTDDEGNAETLESDAYPSGGTIIEAVVSSVLVRFGSSSYSATEGASVPVTVELSDTPSSQVTIPLTRRHPRGAVTEDYSGVPLTLTFGTSDTSKTFMLAATDDPFDDDGESVEVGFGPLPSGVIPGDPSTTTVSLVDNDTAPVPPASVTVSRSALTVTEQDTTGESYTVVLNRQPTSNVAVAVGVFGSSDVNANPATLTFTILNWGTAQTVTVTAGNDADLTNDTVLLTHSAASADAGYQGVTIAGVTVTVNDNDTADATLQSLSLSGVALSPAFSSGVNSYTAIVTDAVLSTTVTAATTQTSAMAVVMLDGVVDSDGAVELAEDTSSFRISVVATAPNRTSTRTYSVTLTRGSVTGTGGGGGDGGGGGGPPPVPIPSDADFDWNVTRDIESLDRDNDLPTGIWSDGKTLWVLQNSATGADSVFAYDLQTGERQPDAEFELDRRNRFSHGIWSNGEIVWVADSGQDQLFAYNVVSGERLEERDIELAERNRDPRGIWSDRKTLYVLDSVKDALFVYDFETGELVAEHPLNKLNKSPRGIWSDGVTLWVSDDGAKRLFAYEFEDATLTRNEDLEFTFRSLLKAGNGNPRGIWSDGDIMYVVDEQKDSVYTYNIPDAIIALLSSLTLSDIEFGEFSSSRRDYTAIAAQEVSATTVVAEAAQEAATVEIEQVDADGDTENGHQVSLDAETTITVTVTSEDGSRSKTYRVRVSKPPCLEGLTEERLSEVSFIGGSVHELEACARSVDLSALYHNRNGIWTALFLFPDLPEFLNRPFRNRFLEGLSPGERLIANRQQAVIATPATTNPN